MHVPILCRSLNIMFRRHITKWPPQSTLLLAKPIPIVCNNRLLSLNHPHSRNEIEKRVMFVLRMYDKIDPELLNLNSNFQTDLGLDSLDHVDVVCAMEEEFEAEIPDNHAYNLYSPERIIRYFCDKFDLYDDIPDINDHKLDVDPNAVD
ncbi:hypothetical protein ACOME3_009413 [Neoechinorhynchus agilis]